MVSSADLTLWGFGIRGLSLRLNGRVGVDLGASDVWPGIEPAVQLIEAYAEYAQPVFTVRGGRQLLANRLGDAGIRRGQADDPARPPGTRGRGLCRPGTRPRDCDSRHEPGPQSTRRLPTQQPPDPGRRRRADTAGPRSMSERTTSASSTGTRGTSCPSAPRSRSTWRPLPHWSLESGVDYDLANTWFGNADAVVRYTSSRITVAGGVRQYRPHFDLWTIWGAFTPVPYHAGNIAVWIRPIRGLELRGQWESYAYSETATETPLVQVDDDGWRLGIGRDLQPVGRLDDWMPGIGRRTDPARRPTDSMAPSPSFRFPHSRSPPMERRSTARSSSASRMRRSTRWASTPSGARRTGFGSRSASRATWRTASVRTRQRSTGTRPACMPA